MPANVKIVRVSQFLSLLEILEVKEDGALWIDGPHGCHTLIRAEEMHEFVEWLADEMKLHSAEYEAIEQGRRPK